VLTEVPHFHPACHANVCSFLRVRSLPGKARLNRKELDGGDPSGAAGGASLEAPSVYPEPAVNGAAAHDRHSPSQPHLPAEIGTSSAAHQVLGLAPAAPSVPKLHARMQSFETTTCSHWVVQLPIVPSSHTAIRR
jgi:hypothetical protein